ncbi:uncharacterized protein TRIADDRAFT_1282, partial [Trichoplax adhaerens]
QDIVLDLRRNEELLTANFFHQLQAADGRGIILDHQIDGCFYHGVVKINGKVRAAISTCRGLNGLVQMMNQSYIIEPLKILDDNDHIVYDPKDSSRTMRSNRCELEDERSNEMPTDLISDDYYREFLKMARKKRNVYSDMKYIELLLVVDNRLAGQFQFENELIKNYVIQVANILDMGFKQLKVRIALTGLITWNVKDEIDVTPDTLGTLNRFSGYRSSQLEKYPNDNAQLLTGIDLAGGTVGMGFISTICMSNSVGISMAAQENPYFTAAITAHELGHNLGFQHDTDVRQCTCHGQISSTGCFMSAVLAGPLPTQFSSCSQQDLEESFSEGLGSCLFNIPTKLYTKPSCGNGFIEEGEQCDCGSVSECQDHCCNASTCMLAPHAACSTGPCCHQCQFQKRGELCREPVNDCDLAEYCSGHDSQCPSNIVKQTGIDCANGAGYCYDGACLTHDEQCKIVFGDNAQSGHGVCWYYVNTNGDSAGYCDKVNDNYIACAPQDVRCGKLQCQGDISHPVIGSSYVWTSTTLYGGGKEFTCISAVIDMGADVPDPGVITDGTKCDENKICLNHKCTSLSSLNIHHCSEQHCSNHGICNNLGHCHCDDGYAPPYCNTTGHGGSLDS